MNIAGNVGEVRGPVPRAEAAGGRGRKRTAVRKPNWKAKFSRLGFMSAMVAILIYGWSLSASNQITAAEGAGYWLGIVGGSAMLLLLIYPLRKRYKWMRGIGSLPRWFQLHMMLGVLGPVLIVVHMGYRLGSPNSTVAFMAMTTVATSGFLGRYFYSKIHLGLYGAKAEVRDLVTIAHDAIMEIAHNADSPAALRKQFDDYESIVLPRSKSLMDGLKAVAAVHMRSGRTHRRLKAQMSREIATAGKLNSWSRGKIRARKRQMKRYLSDYFTAVRRAAEYSFYERLFSLWHVLHVPLFIILVLTAIAHVIAVHLY